MKKLFVLLMVLLMCLSAGSALAADSACARVSIEIIQELTLERVAFDAKLVIHNNLPDKDLENIRVDVTIQDAAGNIKSDLFFLRTSSLDNIDGVAGDGTVTRNTTAEAHWLIIPSPGAGGESVDGVAYFVGATLTYSINGEQTILPINPDKITVKPSPQLYLDYFMPYAVLGDNPFTTQTEAPIPFPLAVRVLNDGFGPANKLKIDSAQPKIVDNQQGLLVNFKLLGAAVNDSAISPSLTVDMGNVASKSAATGYWEMISTLSGRFIEFKASFTHASELGGELTSLIKETNAHYLTRRIKVNLPGRDNRLDFLADTDKDSEHLPDAIFESEIPSGGVDRNDARAAVTVVVPTSLPTRPTPEEPQVQTTLGITAHSGGWIYTKMADPSQGLLKLEKVVRADGVALDSHNFWVEEGLDQNYKPTFTLQFVDYRANVAAPGRYNLLFTQPDEDVTPPTSTLVFDGLVVAGETTYLTPETRIVLTARDNEGGSGVDQMFRKVGDDPAFVAALPFNLSSGEYTLDYYSVDRAGNVEPTKSQTLVVDDAAPTLSAALTVTPATFAPQAPAGVSSAQTVTFAFIATDNVPELPVTLEISANGSVVRTLTGKAASGSPYSLVWDGLDKDGQTVAAGSYIATLTVTDGLGHPLGSEVTVMVAEWFAGTPVDPWPGARQMNPAISGTQVVWQDDRDGHFSIYHKDLAGTAPSFRLSSAGADQERPAIDGNLIVWQDQRNGDFDVYAHELASGQTFVVYAEAGDQTHPVVAGDWVAWQDNRSGNWDIWAKNLVSAQLIQITTHDRDQIRPVLDGTLVVWEDYRHGLGEIYQYDLVSGVETRLTFDSANQFLPVISGGVVVWTDQRDGVQEIYRQTGANAQRLTYGNGERSQASLREGLLVYTDFSEGNDDPNLAFLDLASGSGSSLSSHPARQEEPAVGAGIVVWQDDRDSTWQLYQAALETSTLPVTVALKPGFNFAAAGQLLVDSYGSAANLVGAAGLNLEKAMSYSAPHDQFFAVDGASGGDFALVPGAGLVLYAATEGTLPVAASGETAVYSLLAGTNHIGLLSVPYGYRAFDLLRSVGLTKIVSVRRFDNSTGLWQSAAVRDNGGTPELVGSNFSIKPGDGLVVTMNIRVDGWQP